MQKEASPGFKVDSVVAGSGAQGSQHAGKVFRRRIQFEARVDEAIAGHPGILGARGKEHMFEQRRAQVSILAEYSDEPLVGVVAMCSMPVQPLDPIPDAVGSDCRVGLKDRGNKASHQPCDVPLRLEIGLLQHRPCGIDQTVKP